MSDLLAWFELELLWLAEEVMKPEPEVRLEVGEGQLWWLLLVVLLAFGWFSVCCCDPGPGPGP